MGNFPYVPSLRVGPRAEKCLLLAAEQPAEDLPDRIALTATAATEHAAQDAAERVVATATATARTAQDAAEDVTEPTAAGRRLLRLCLGRRRALRQLLADVGQHDRSQNRKQL